MAIENTSQDLADLLATKNFDVKYKDAQGNDCSAEEASVFAFDWIAGSGKNYGTVVIVLGDDNDFQVFFGDNLGRTMDDPEDKLDWFGSERHTGFLEELSRFAIQHRYLFSPKNINQLKHTMQGMASIKEGLFESYYGTRSVSYMGERTDARLMIRHNRTLGEDDKRYRYVESLFIETADGERFRLPFVKLTGGRAMLEHVRQGGKPYDMRGQHICEIVSEMQVLSRFNRARQGRVFEGVTQELVDNVNTYYGALQENLRHISNQRGYQRYFESWTPADISETTALVEDLKTLFVEQTLDARIEAALPTLAKIQQQGRAMKEAQIFENWVSNLAEGTWALPDTPEAQAKLDELMSKELIVGPDATNATEQLYDIVGDDELFDILHDLAKNDPRANIWDDTDVQARLQELGIQMNTTPAADQQQPVAPAAGQQAPGTAPEQAVREGAQPTEKVSAVIKRVLGDKLLWGRRISELRKSPRANYDRYLMQGIRVYDNFGGNDIMPEPFSANAGQPLAKKLKRELIKAGYPVSSDLIIYPEAIMFNVRKPTTTAEQGVAEAQQVEEMDKSQTPPGRDGGHQFEPGPKVSKKVIKAVTKDPAKHLSDLFAKEYDKKKKGVAEGAPELLKQEMPLVRHIEQELAQHGYEKGTPEYDQMYKHTMSMYRKFGNVDAIKQGVAEGIELNSILKYAGVPVKESMLNDSTGETLDHILNRFKNEVKRFQNGDEIDTELYYALFDYYNDHGEMPYGVAKARDGDPVNWISDKLSAKLGVDENLMAPMAMPVTTEGSTCNMTAEGEYCPEHGLAECGYMESMGGTVAGSVAPMMDEAPQDPINRNDAITGAYYESDELARIKSLALLK